MAIHIQDEEVDWLVREFARSRGVGITAAVKLAIEEATADKQRSFEAYWRRVEPIIEEVRAMPDIERVDHKAFTDDGWGKP